jgi:NAD(P)-dependent dehydrogenase (short-subunit alcohol dehydrogenase family)
MKINHKNPFTLEGKNILITGASSGLGKQCAIRCSSSGASLLITGRDSLRLKQTCDTLGPGAHRSFEADLQEFDHYESTFVDQIRSFGPIDGIVHSAGVELTLPLNMMKPKHFQSLFNINVISGFDLTGILLKRRLFSKNASIVFIASIMGILGQSGKVGYCSSKGALISGVKALALELAPLGLRANSILPAVCKTKMTTEFMDNLTDEALDKVLKMHPMGLGDPDDIALAAVYLLSNASKWITGSSLIVDGGYSAM